MDGLNLSNNITQLRHQRKLTQEELADFMGVTKASVSKWENAQSMPDILLLPQLASFFDVTIDELLGYEAQLSGEQIRRHYAQLTRDFAVLPFQEALEKTRALAHRYYSCYPFLLQLVILYWNHSMLAEGEAGRQILQEAVLWCDRILENCGDVGICDDALALKAGLYVQLGQPLEAIDLLEPLSDPSRISCQNSAMLIQAYQMAGEIQKAKSYAQVEQYLEVVNLVGDGIQILSLYAKDAKRSQETIRRIQGVMEIYGVERLHPNLAAQFYFQTAVVCGLNGKTQEACQALGAFEKCVRRLLDAEELVLHGDDYFDLLDTWIDRQPLGNMAPRDKSFIRQSVQDILRHPAFEKIKETEEFQRIARLWE